MLRKSPAALCSMISKYREIVGPGNSSADDSRVQKRRTIEYDSYSNMVIPEGITNLGDNKSFLIFLCYLRSSCIVGVTNGCTFVSESMI